MKRLIGLVVLIAMLSSSVKLEAGAHWTSEDSCRTTGNTACVDTGGYGYADCICAPNYAPAILLGTLALAGIIVFALVKPGGHSGH